MPIIGIIGKKRTGKDTLAAALVAEHGFRRLAFADRLKAMALDVNPAVDSDLDGRMYSLAESVAVFGWERTKDECPEARRFLQTLGVAVREHIDGDAWVRPVLQEAAAATEPIVITDVRFPNEAEAIRAAGGYLIRIERPSVSSCDSHVSESGLPDVPVDYVICNTGSVNDLLAHAQVIARLASS